jgi:O-antigen/teichoic acid export membrane protein
MVSYPSIVNDSNYFRWNMGIIQKQSIKSSLFILIGFGIGAVNMLVLFPKFLSQGEYGLTRAMIDISLTLSTLCTLGSVTVIYKFYPFYNSYLGPKKNDLPMITAAVSLTGYLVIVICGVFAKDFIARKLGKSPEFARYFYTVYPYTFLLLMFSWLEGFSWGLKRTVITSFLRETGVRLLTTALVILFAFKVFGINTFFNLFSLLYLIPVLILLFALIRSGKWKFSILPLSSVTRRLKSRMVSFGLFVFGASFLNVLAKTNDTILIIGIKGLADTAVFAIATYVLAVLEIPQRSLNGISIPVLAESWKNKDLANIEHIYEKSVTNLLVIGLGMFGFIYLNIHNLTAFLGKNFSQIEEIVLIMGIAKVLDLGTGINAQIIGTSNFWKFDFYTNCLYTILSIPLNFLLIKHFGLKGLAFSTLISLTTYNSIRFLFLYFKFGFQPYTPKSALVILVAVLSFLLVKVIPRQHNIYLDTIVRSMAFSLLFFPVLYASAVSPDLNQLVKNSVTRLLKRK